MKRIGIFAVLLLFSLTAATACNSENDISADGSSLQDIEISSSSSIDPVSDSIESGYEAEPQAKSIPVDFVDKCFELGIRAYLGKNEFEYIYPEELEPIKFIRISGKISENKCSISFSNSNILDFEGQYISDQYAGISQTQQGARIDMPLPTTLVDLKWLPNLEVFIGPSNSLYGQDGPYHDMSFLEYIPDVLYLDIGSQPTDITPLRYCKNLRGLVISHGEIQDYSPLAELENLEFLNIWGQVPQDISFFEFLENINTLKSLIINLTEVEDLSPLRHVQQIEYLMYYGGSRHQEIREYLSDVYMG